MKKHHRYGSHVVLRKRRRVGVLAPHTNRVLLLEPLLSSSYFLTNHHHNPYTQTSTYTQDLRPASTNLVCTF